MSSIYLVRRGERWLTHGLFDWRLTADVAAAEVFRCRESAEWAARMLNAEPVEFREVAGDTEAGALAEAQRLIRRHAAEINRRRGDMAVARELLDELGVPAEIDGVTLGFCQRIKLLAKRGQESTDG